MFDIMFCIIEFSLFLQILTFVPNCAISKTRGKILLNRNLELIDFEVRNK